MASNAACSSPMLAVLALTLPDVDLAIVEEAAVAVGVAVAATVIDDVAVIEEAAVDDVAVIDDVAEASSPHPAAIAAAQSAASVTADRRTAITGSPWRGP